MSEFGFIKVITNMNTTVKDSQVLLNAEGNIFPLNATMPSDIQHRTKEQLTSIMDSTTSTPIPSTTIVPKVGRMTTVKPSIEISSTVLYTTTSK
jgi:hypothetical protein